MGIDVATMVALLCACASSTTVPAIAPTARRVAKPIRCFMERRFGIVTPKSNLSVYRRAVKETVRVATLPAASTSRSAIR